MFHHMTGNNQVKRVVFEGNRLLVEVRTLEDKSFGNWFSRFCVVNPEVSVSGEIQTARSSILPESQAANIENRSVMRYLRKQVFEHICQLVALS